MVLLYVVAQYGQCGTHLSICEQDIILPLNDLAPLVLRLGPEHLHLEVHSIFVLVDLQVP